MAETKGLTVRMTVDKETPGTIRFKEVQAGEGPAVIGQLYVPKETVAKLGSPRTLIVSLEAEK